MATPKERFSEVARTVAEHSQARARQHRKDLLDAEQRVVEIKAKLEAADLAFERLANFEVQRGRDYQCPRCWIEKKTRSVMDCRPGTDTYDLWECPTCGLEIDIPFGH